MNNIRIVQIIKSTLVFLLLISCCPLSSYQLFIFDQAEVFVGTNGIVKVNGNVEIQNGATLTMNGLEITIEGNLIQDGNFTISVGKLRFSGTGNQNVSGSLTGANAPFDLVIEQGDNNSSVDLFDDLEVKNTLEFLVGKINTQTNEIYIKNEAANAIIGHFVPNITDGTYTNNGRFVEGMLARDVNPSISTTYIFPVGSSGGFYNPVQLENLGGSAGKIIAGFSSENLGPINFTGVVDCSVGNPAYAGSASNVAQSNSVNTDIEYAAMTSQGVWDISSATSYDYDLVAYPNAANTDVNPSASGQYHLLKRPSGDDPSSDWTAFALSGNPCVNASNYFELAGTGFSGFSIFGVAAIASAALPVELIDFNAEVIDNEFVKLNWATASETNNLGFEIERKLDGQAFETIGWQDGFRDSESERNYVFDDKSVFKNEWYFYRLKQIDVDGRFEYSKIVTAKISGGLQIEIFPNPSHDDITIHLSDDLQKESLSLEIFDVLGRRVFYKKEVFNNSNSYQFSFLNSNLSKGIYFIKISSWMQDIAFEKVFFN